MIDPVIDTLRRVVTEQEQLVSAALVSGGAKDYAAYRELVAKLETLAFMRNELSRVEARLLES